MTIVSKIEYYREKKKSVYYNETYVTIMRHKDLLIIMEWPA